MVLQDGISWSKQLLTTFIALAPVFPPAHGHQLFVLQQLWCPRDFPWDDSIPQPASTPCCVRLVNQLKEGLKSARIQCKERGRDTWRGVRTKKASFWQQHAVMLVYIGCRSTAHKGLVYKLSVLKGVVCFFSSLQLTMDSCCFPSVGAVIHNRRLWLG